VIFFFCHVAEQEVTLVHVASGLPSTVIVSFAMPLAEFADTAMLALLLIVAPLIGEVIVIVGGVGMVAPGVDVVPVLAVVVVLGLKEEGAPGPEEEVVPVLAEEVVPVLEEEVVAVPEEEVVAVLEGLLLEVIPNPARM
jgi:hypothetical protein